MQRASPQRQANGQVEIHHAVDEDAVCSTRPCGPATVGVDKGYTAAYTDGDEERHGEGLGDLLSAESDHHKAKGTRRNQLWGVAEKHRAKGHTRRPTPSGSTTSATKSGTGGSPCTTDRCATISVRPPTPSWTRPASSCARTCPRP